MHTVDGQAAHDYELSFWFSQGDPDLQKKLFQALGQEYSKLYSDEKLLEFAKRDHRSPGDLAPNFPHGHEKHHPKKIKDEFKRTWHDFRNSIIWGRDQDNTQKNYQGIASLMVERDRKFISVGRFALSDFQPDPHASFFRNYVLLETPTTSPTFDATFQDIRSSLPEIMDIDGLAENVLALQALWQQHHPEDDFGPLPTMIKYSNH